MNPGLLAVASILAALIGYAAIGQTPAPVVTPATVTESVRSATDAISGSARDSLRGSDRKADEAATAGLGRSGTPAPVETKTLGPER